MTEDKVESFRKIEMPAEREPEGEGRGGADDGGNPGAEDRRHLGGNQGEDAIRQLHQQRECP